MLSDVDECEMFLSLAFDHFSESLDTPFDLVKASLKISPPPENFMGNVYRFLLSVEGKKTRGIHSYVIQPAHSHGRDLHFARLFQEATNG